MKLTNYERGYLVGIIDGEGSIFLNKMKTKRSKLGFNLRPCISIDNTKIDLINECFRILSKIIKNERYKTTIKTNTGYKINDAVEKQRHHWKGQWKISYRVRIHDFDSIIRILSEIKDFLIIKKKQAGILYKFCISRKTKLWQFRRYGYSNRELNSYVRLRMLNKRGL